MGRDGKISYQGGVGKAGLILLSEARGFVVSAEQSGAVQFIGKMIYTGWIELARSKLHPDQQIPIGHKFDL